MGIYRRHDWSRDQPGDKLNSLPRGRSRHEIVRGSDGLPRHQQTRRSAGQWAAP